MRARAVGAWNVGAWPPLAASQEVPTAEQVSAFANSCSEQGNLLSRGGRADLSAHGRCGEQCVDVATLCFHAGVDFTTLCFHAGVDFATLCFHAGVDFATLLVHAGIDFATLMV